MSEMVERVARAMFIAEQAWRRTPVPGTVLNVVMARAALEAMREPTEGMINAADPHGIIMADFQTAWRDMIDEALKG
jgi:hypothetical protein